MLINDNKPLKVKFPSIDEMQRSMEARGDGGFGGGNKGGGFGNKGGKDKKNGQWIMIPLLLGSTLVPLAFGALALLAGKVFMFLLILLHLLFNISSFFNRQSPYRIEIGISIR